MIWMFERDHDDLKVENFLDDVTGEHVLVLRHPDRSQTVERYSSVQTFEKRLELLDGSLRDNQWRKIGTGRAMKNTWQL